MRKGLRVSILKNAELGDCTNGGISATRKSLTLVGPDIPEIFEATPDAPAVVIIGRIIGGRLYNHAEPLEPVPAGHNGYMAGGNFIHTSDSRFPSDYPLSLHDRTEVWGVSERMSR